MKRYTNSPSSLYFFTIPLVATEWSASCKYNSARRGNNLQDAEFKWKSRLPSIWSWNLRTPSASRCRTSCTIEYDRGTGHRQATVRTLPYHNTQPTNHFNAATRNVTRNLFRGRGIFLPFIPSLSSFSFPLSSFPFPVSFPYREVEVARQIQIMLFYIFAATRHVPWTLNTPKMRLRPSLSCKRIFGVFRVQGTWLQMSSYFC